MVASRFLNVETLRIRTFALIFSAVLVPLAVLGQATPPLEPSVNHAESSLVMMSPSVPVITIEADSFNLYVDEEKAVFRGNVNASQGNTTFRTSQLTVHLDQVNTKAAKNDGQAGSQENRVPPYELSARTLTYELDSRLAVGKGDSLLKRGRELILAELINYDMAKRVAYAIPDSGGRVMVRFYSNPDMPLFPSQSLAKSTAAE